MLDWTTELGLDLTRWTSGALGYVSPPFERNALAASGLADLPDAWRRGDLVVFRRTRPTNRPRPVVPNTEQWAEVSVDAVRIRVRADQSTGYGNPALRSLLDGDVLDSVSRRWVRRGEVQVWTSTNRVFACRATAVLRELLFALAATDDPHSRVEAYAGRSLTADERGEVAAAVIQVNEVLAAERRDLARWGWTLTTPAKEVGSAEPAA